MDALKALVMELVAVVPFMLALGLLYYSIRHK